MGAVIAVENLGKKYLIGHQRHSGQRNLRDAMTHTARAVWQRLRHPLSPNREMLDLEEIWALKDVTFEVQQSERVGIIGRNGAGKSTLLKVLSRITHPTTGRVRLRGRVSSLLEVGTGFHPELTGRENIFLNGAILGMTRQEIKAKFDEIVAFAEIEKFLDTPVKHYSSGMYVRLAFAVAAHLEPEILIVDEVLAVGDAAFQKKCLGKMSEVAQDGRTILFVSHNMTAMMNLCSRCIYLAGGAVAAVGSPKSIVDVYLERQFRQGQFVRDSRLQGDRRVVVEDLIVRTPTLRTGEPFECEVVVRRSDDPDSELPAELSLDFLSETEGRVLQLYSRHMGQQFNVAHGRSSFLVRLDRLPLVPGRYELAVWIGFSHATFDVAMNCYGVTVSPGCLRPGTLVEDRGFPVVAPARWIRLP